MGRVVIPGFRKIETSGGGEGGTTNYNDLTNKPSINNVPLVGNLNTVNLKLTDATLTEEGVPAEAKTVGQKLEEQSTSLTALSGQLGNHTVKSDVPENAVFTDTVYDDTEVKESISQQSTEMMDIKMLGWSVPRECPIQNEVNGNQFIQKIGRADMSKLAWSTYSSTGIFRFSSESGAEYTKYNIKQGSFAYLRDYNYVGNSTSWSDISNYGNNTIMGVFAGGNDDGFILTNHSYTNSSDFKQAMQGQYLYYELATYNTMTIDGNEEVVKVAEDVDNLKNDLDKLNSLPIGSIIQIEAAKDNIETTTQKYGWQYLGTSNIQYERGNANLLVTNVYRKNE